MKFLVPVCRAAWIGTVIVGFAAQVGWSQVPATNPTSASCKECHEDRWNRFQSNPHGRAAMDAHLVSDLVGCESCHGSGEAHAAAGGDSSQAGFASIRNFKKISAQEATAVCTSCHKGGEQMHWPQSEHARRDISCVQCHSIHSSKSPGEVALLKTTDVNKLCLQCHLDKQISMTRTGHMPLREGGMTCADCHNPHGTPTPHNLRAQSTNELCLSCHGDKRGPFLWEHAPVRENCLNCHDPHGSINTQVLASKVPFLCQRCHITTRHPSVQYDAPDLANNRLFNRACVNCHSQIHGSNHPSGKFFLR
jgi:DmsE family decaheme c-type cytochrome